MEPNPQTILYHLKAKRPWWSSRRKEIVPGDRTAIRPDREDFPHDRWLILRVPLGGDHMGGDARRAEVLEWEESLFAWLDPHPTAMWDGHELGCGEFKLYLLTPSPADLLREFADRGTPLPTGTRAFTRVGQDGDEIPLRTP